MALVRIKNIAWWDRHGTPLTCHLECIRQRTFNHTAYCGPLSISKLSIYCLKGWAWFINKNNGISGLVRDLMASVLGTVNHGACWSALLGAGWGRVTFFLQTFAHNILGASLDSLLSFTSWLLDKGEYLYFLVNNSLVCVYLCVGGISILFKLPYWMCVHVFFCVSFISLLVFSWLV